MTRFVAYGAVPSIQYDALTDVIFEIGLGCLVPLAGSVAVDTCARRDRSCTLAKVANVIIPLHIHHHLKRASYILRAAVTYMGEAEIIVPVLVVLAVGILVGSRIWMAFRR